MSIIRIAFLFFIFSFEVRAGILGDLIEAKKQRKKLVAEYSKVATEHFIEHNDIKRRYVVYLPPSLKDAAGPFPLVLGFHGGGGYAENFADTSGFNEVANKNKFLMVYPEGTGPLGKILTFNAGTCCGTAAKNKVDDVGFVKSLITELQKNYNIDSKRIFVTGFSNGGMISYRIAAELSDIIAAAGIVGADLGVDGPKPKRSVPIIHLHGMKDENVRWLGGHGQNQIDKSPHRSIPDTLKIWRNWNNCMEKPIKYEATKDYVMERYEPASGVRGAPVVVYKLPEAGHVWPGGRGPVLKSMNSGLMVANVKASELIWEFFASQTQSLSIK